MAKRRCELDSVVTASEMSEFNTVFVDTSLDTHLAMLVSSTDTVSDLKKKMALEHKQCFPTIGEILVLSVKVKRRSNFYHLPDIMLVWSAFHGVKHNWFLSADVSGADTFHSIKTSCEFDTNNGVKMGVTNLDDNCRGFSSDVNRIKTLSIPLPDGATQKNVASEMIAGLKFEKSVEKTTDFKNNSFPVEKCMGTDSRPKKKRKVRNTEDACHNPRSEDDCNLFQSSSGDALISEVVGSGNVMVDAVRESPGGGTLQEQNGKENDHYDAVDKVMFIGTSPPTKTEKSTLRSALTSQNLLASDERKDENKLEGKMDHELAQDAPVNLLECVSIRDHSPRLTDTGDWIGELDTDGNKSEKNKVQKTGRNVQVTTYMDQTEKGVSIQPCSETHESDKKEEAKGLSLEPSNSNAFGHVALESGLKETSFLRDADAAVEPEISSGTKMKKNRKKRKKHINTNSEQSGIEQTNYSISGSPPPPSDHIPEETGKEEDITNHEGKDFQVLLGSSTGDATEKDRNANKNVGDTVMLTQTERALEDVGAGKKITDIKAQNSASNPHADFPHADFPAAETEVDKGNESMETKDRKASKRRKKRKLTTSQVQEDLLVEGHNLGGLATKETSICFVNSELEERHIDSCQALSSKSEEKLNATSGIVQNTYHLEKTSEKEGKGINFKQYFIPTKSSQEMVAPKRVEDNVVPSVCNSTELQSSIKYFENKMADDKSRRKSSSRSKGDSTQNSDRNETISNSFRRSSGASEKGVKDYGPSEMCETTLQKPDGALAASSRQDKKNRRSLYISSTEKRVEVFPVKQGNKRFQLGANVTHKMLMRTPQKKSLLTKPGAIFEDDSGESSGDENGTMHSDGSTLSPSDSSSMSGNSEESDLSHGSTRNGSSYADGRSTGRRSMPKLELSTSKDDITMDMILRSSKRFKKAKLLASKNAADEENESQPIEYVPNSQPS